MAMQASSTMVAVMVRNVSISAFHACVACGDVLIMPTGFVTEPTDEQLTFFDAIPDGTQALVGRTVRGDDAVKRLSGLRRGEQA